VRGVAVSDLHLGKRQFTATEGGRNAREIDVERAWAHAVDRIIEAQPDLVTVAGDIFEHPRVGMHAVRAWRDGVRRIVTETDAHLIAIQGNHDAGRTSEVLTPIVIPGDYPRVHIVTEPKRIRLEIPRTGELVSIACFPFVALGEEASYSLDPDPDAALNVLLMHAAVRTTAEGVDALPAFYAGETALDVGREADRWDVVAVGDYHEFQRLHPTALAFYSGSIERTSSNIWPEVDPKGVVVYDTGTREMELVEIPTRLMLDYDMDDILGGDEAGWANNALHVNAALHNLVGVEDGKLVEGAIVRLVVDDFPRAERDQIDWALVRQLKQACLHFQLDLRWADRVSAEFGDRRERVVRSLNDEAADFFGDDPAEVRELAMAYLGGGV
jgi:DNA repair exonuclease SbcCD nuclease subunit